MAHITKREPWGTIDVDVLRGRVFVREDWRYVWTTQGVVPPWTPVEQAHYHRAVDHLVWAHWSLRARIWASDGPGSNDVARQLVERIGGTGLTLSFDVRRVQTKAQWTAVVTKVDPDVKPKPRAHVWFAQRRLELYSTDVVSVHASRSETDTVRRPHFFVAPHEFGHTLGCGDDYLSNRYFGDVASIMNIGRVVRPRHLALVTETLHKMVPGCKFVAVMH